MVMNPLLTTGGRHDTYAMDEPSSTCPEISVIFSGAVCSCIYFMEDNSEPNQIHTFWQSGDMFSGGKTPTLRW